MISSSGLVISTLPELRFHRTRIFTRSEDSETEPFEIPEYPYGISIILAYPREIIRGIHDEPTMEYYNAYNHNKHQLDDLMMKCADYIKSQGYNAYAQTGDVKEFGIFRTIMPNKTVAVKAGLGWIGKSALFITEDFGSAVRLGSVLTDMPVPCPETIFQSRCGSCMLCTKACPGGAISGRNWSPDLDRDDFYDAMACRKKAREIAARVLNKKATLCGKCMEVCPYTRRYTEAVLSNT
jgi:epoxyqueuosine reductase QueG